MPHTTQKRKSKWIREINVKIKDIQVQEENIGELFFNFCTRKDFLTMTQNAAAVKDW